MLRMPHACVRKLKVAGGGHRASCALASRRRPSASSYYESTTTKKNLKINCNLILNGDDTRASMHDERLC